MIRECPYFKMADTQSRPKLTFAVFLSKWFWQFLAPETLPVCLGFFAMIANTLIALKFVFYDSHSSSTSIG